MLKTRMKRLAARDARALDMLTDIERSITNLDDEDLLDIADIFRGERRSLIGELARREMAKRNISL